MMLVMLKKLNLIYRDAIRWLKGERRIPEYHGDGRSSDRAGLKAIKEGKTVIIDGEIYEFERADTSLPARATGPQTK